MILEVDFGNSRIKWRFLAENNAAAPVYHVASLSELFARLVDSEEPAATRVASVRSDDTLAKFSAWISNEWQQDTLVAKTARHCAGVKNSYADESRMGVDRWLAMLSAFARAKGPCVVVDAGTAITVDVLAATGDHVGGFILPGLRLMTDALEANTGIRLHAEEAVPSREPGRSTEQAVRNGALAAAVALIETTCARSMQGDAGRKLFLSGGDAPLLSQALEKLGEAEILPDLVLDGLALACPVAGEQ